MARRDKPINAGVPAAPEAEPRTEELAAAGAAAPADAVAAPSAPVDKADAEAPDWPVKRREPAPPPAPAVPSPAPPARRRQVPAALKGIAALVLVAIVFIVAAILGGGSGDDGGGAIPGGGRGQETTTTAPPVAVAEGEPPEELGYPELATNNTTRIPGADPVSNAAAVSLAVYPSGEEDLGPAAVTLVDGSDWQAGIAASVLMAEPLRAPLLISGAEEVPEATAAAVEELRPQGTRLAGDAQAIAVGAAAVPEGLRTRRVGATGIAAAAAIARLRDRLFGGPPRHFVLVPAARPELAMPAAAWAARSGDPVLFTGAGRLPKPTREALREHPRAPVYVLGPPSAVSADVLSEVEGIGGSATRVAGADPVATAIALARFADGDFGWNVNDPGHGFVVARSDRPLDAAAAAPLSASGTWGPLLLTDDADTLPEALRDYLLDVKPGYTSDPTRAFYNHVWLIGDTEAIDVSQQAEIDELAELARIGGEP